jgi:predicted metal-binding protein
MDLGDKILGGGYSCDICRVVCNLRACDEPRISRVSIREIGGPLTSQLTTIYIISIRLINY